MEQEKETFQFVENEIKEEKKEELPVKTVETQEEDFVTGLPDWDLVPPYEVVRRVTR